MQNGDDSGMVIVRFERADPNNPRPDTLEIRYVINGEEEILGFKNEQGGGQ